VHLHGLHAFQVAELVGNRADQAVLVQEQAKEVGERTERCRDGPGQLVEREVEDFEVSRVGQLAWNRARELVGVKVTERSHQA